uniref:DUF3778 domain-containing protein n=1 Tax=Oryza barthii TaxID=65489 RepID=A0A0D3EIR2_9ORYZ
MNRQKKLAPCGSVSGFVIGVREVAAPDGGGSFLRPASPGQAIAQSLLLVVLDCPLARWRQFCQCMLECFLCHGSISQVSQDFSPHSRMSIQEDSSLFATIRVLQWVWGSECGLLLSLCFPPAHSMQGLLFGLSSHSSDLTTNSSSWRQPDGDYRFVKRAARQRRPKVAFVAALPQLPVDFPRSFETDGFMLPFDLFGNVLGFIPVNSVALY